VQTIAADALMAVAAKRPAPIAALARVLISSFIPYSLGLPRARWKILKPSIGSLALGELPIMEP
jgi:hypothetical protein